ncbi:SMI1/KNR4 family protein [Streptomyces sp. NBC_01275]|uniref:SMI1/KNR4 family protein n=1 Tax=Streptomyces sp. NBC_01275 TaxID=2903807 RepID=UPI002256006D|nr:SMI1/KNR4 family protein [Streptomyces sp. NBC_01275]MCX4765607.1 SMI1/KNR4 family protein [Streptomyces sp. NBC_01275]
MAEVRAEVKTAEFDLDGGLTRALRGRAEAWEFVRGFAAYWGWPLEPGDGWDDVRLGEVEGRLGVRLPAALREAYGLFGRRGDLTCNQDELLAPEALYVEDGVLVYQVENQSCAYWGVPLADLGQDDPGTVARPDAPGARWEAWEPSLSVACVAMIMAETLFRQDGFTDYVELDEDVDLEVLGLRRLPDVGRGSRWFAGPDVLIRELDGGFVFVRARTEAALDAVREAVPGDWLEG